MRFVKFFFAETTIRRFPLQIQNGRVEVYAFRASKILEKPTFFRPHFAWGIYLYHPPPQPGIMVL